MDKTSVANRSRVGLSRTRSNAKWWIATLLVVGVALLGQGRAEALWTEGCSQDQQSYITGGIIGAYYALQSANQTYSTNSDRANYYFGVGYDDAQVHSTLQRMWDVMNDQNLTVVCAQQTDGCNYDIVHEIVWAYSNRADVENGISRIQVCDLFFNDAPGEQDVLASPAGFLLHEMAHLAGVPRYTDEVGIWDVRNLATNYTSLAPWNADNYRYYIFNIYYTYNDAQWESM